MPADSQEVSEGLEGTGSQSQTDGETPCTHRSADWVETRLSAISEMARKDPKCRFSNLAYLLCEEYLAQCFRELDVKAAPGVDMVTWGKYQRELPENLADLVRRMKAMQYRPQPVRRVYIPKDTRSLRPLGIPAVEDKVVQMGMARILEAVFEGDFLDVSFGFRPGRGCHQALGTLDRTISNRPVNFVLDADIKGFFDSVDHKKLMNCLKGRIADANFLRLVTRFLKAGVMEDGVCRDVDKGTPQGGVISPVLSNIFLHYALDTWFEGNLKKRLRGYAGLVRYADDFVILLQYKDDADLVMRELEVRLAQCGLELSKEKTRLLDFGKYARGKAAASGKKPGTFDFLGFTHYCDRTRQGKFKVGRKTSRKKFHAKARALNDWLRHVRSALPLKHWWPILVAKLEGHFRYYGVSGNYDSLRRFLFIALRLVFKWLNRRSQKRSFNWESFNLYLQRHPLPKPRIHHDLYALSHIR